MLSKAGIFVMAFLIVGQIKADTAQNVVAILERTIRTPGAVEICRIFSTFVEVRQISKPIKFTNEVPNCDKIISLLEEAHEGGYLRIPADDPDVRFRFYVGNLEDPRAPYSVFTPVLLMRTSEDAIATDSLGGHYLIDFMDANCN